ncbi:MULTISPECIES: glycosyltransferase family 2 protein [Haloarcula]|uniref:glycosyltransferase family 2 protein n=1 Tax=Haloarcula TaxID=2237 RepID=UPI000F8CCABF|nr:MULTISPECIES: glycosyltransferase family 2 protein [Haloarcula]NHX41497.1 glycosyltransferase [Haloarcula sp. R1-2]
MLKLSIVTICYNCRDEIEDTINSVLDQTYDHIEYIVIDGASTDGTAEYLADRADEFDTFVSKPDDGIYSAMNKGLRRATGDYIMFVNGGDRLINSSAIERVLNRTDVREERPVIISGRIELMYEGEPMEYYRPWRAGAEGPGLPHPATMVDREVHQAHPFDEQYTYIGDYELWARFRDEQVYDVMYVDDVLTLFDVEGISNSSDVAFERYLERSFIDYKYTGEFGIGDAALLLFLPLVRQLLSTMLGQRKFIKLLRYRRLVKRFVQEQSKN